MLKRTEGDNAANVIKDDKLNLMNLMDKITHKELFDIMIGETGDGLGYAIYDELLEFYKVAIKSDPYYINLSKILFSTDTLPDREKWVKEQFSYIPLIALFNQLSVWQRNIRYVESVIIQSVFEKSV